MECPGGAVLLEARLEGGAPWGFSLAGGLETYEPLVISKVEPGGRASSLQHPLQAGDELLQVNQQLLSGFRQEAVGLVKSSWSRLELTLRRQLKSCDCHPIAAPCRLQRRSETGSRPHSWHSSKVERQDDVLTVACVSTTDLDTLDPFNQYSKGNHGYHGDQCDRYSSLGSMDSLDPPPSSHRPHPLGHHGNAGPNPTYSSCHQLSSARSGSMDHLHSKRDSAYSSFSTSSSIPEYLAAGPAFSSERSYSLEAVPQRGEDGGLQPADQCVRAVCDNQRSQSQEHGLSPTSAALLHSSDAHRDRQTHGSMGGVCYRGSSSSSGASSRHSVGPIWAPPASHSSWEGLQGAEPPSQRSNSYTAVRNQERPSSWSNMEHSRSLRSLHKGSWHHSSGSVASGRGCYAAELHTVLEKSPESSPTTRPRQPAAQPPRPLLATVGHNGPPPAPPYAHWPPQQENGFQNIPPPSSSSSSASSASSASSSVVVSSSRQTDRRTYAPLPGQAAEGQVGPHRPPQEPQERRDPFTPVQPRHRSSSPCRRPLEQQAAPGPPRPPGEGGGARDPLDRLEMALAEVQRCATPKVTQENGFCGDSGQVGVGVARSMSVLEKVSRFERRSARTCLDKQPCERGRGAPCGVEDPRGTLERAQSYRGLPVTIVTRRVLQRSRSSFKLEGEQEEGGQEAVQTYPWRQDLQELLGSIHDPSVSRASRGSQQEVQTRAQGSYCSPRRRDTPPPVPPKHRSLERRSSRMGPGPSPYIPRERHEAGPEVRGPSPPPLPILLPVGPAHSSGNVHAHYYSNGPARICGRRRLTAEQRKRSYSEPDSINEVGVSDPETAALFRRGGETSVADRRRMFELAASRSLGGVAWEGIERRQNLRQLQQEALAAYVEKRRGSSQDRRQRPHKYSTSGTSLQDSDPDWGDPRAGHPPGPGTEPCRQAVAPAPGPGLSQQAWRPRQSQGLSWELCGAGGVSGQAASAEDLLVRCEEAPHSSPDMETPAQDTRMSRPTDGQTDSSAPPAAQGNSSSASCQGQLPVTRGRQRPSDRQRALSTPSLAASVGLPCPLSPAGAPSWQGDTSPSHLDAISFPEDERASLSHASLNHASLSHASLNHFRLSHCSLNDANLHHACLNDASISHDSLSHASLNHASISHDSLNDASISHDSLSHASLNHVSLSHCSLNDANLHHACLNDASISHDSLNDASISHDSLNDVSIIHDSFSHASNNQVSVSNANLSHGRGSQSRLVAGEASLWLEGRRSLPSDIPPDLTNVDRSWRDNGRDTPVSLETRDISSVLGSLRTSESSSQLQSSVSGETGMSLEQCGTLLSPPPPPIREDPSPPLVESSVETDSLQYLLLTRRGQTSTHRRVEALSRQLVLCDCSLAPLLDTWQSKSTIELMEGIFPCTALAVNMLWQRSPSTRLGESSVQDGVCSTGHAQTCDPEQKVEKEQEEAETELNTLKGELCEELRRSAVVLREDKEALMEERRRHQALGSRLDQLVQTQCKANERDKYRMFIGDLQKIVQLLWSLCGRLSRLDRRLLVQEPDDSPEDRVSLHNKRSQLVSQIEDARELKDNLDRRQRVVMAILSGCLAEQHLCDYRRYVSTTPWLLIGQKHLDELLARVEEQLTRLVESLPPRLAVPAPSSRLRWALGHAHPTHPTTVTSL